MNNVFSEDTWTEGTPDIGSIFDRITECGGSLDVLCHAMSGVRDLPLSEKDGILRRLRDLQRKLDDCEIEASRII